MKHDIRGLKLAGQSWVYSYRIAGRARRMTIGHAPGLILADARKAAQHFAGLVAIGRRPSSERKAGRIAARVASAPVRDLIEPVLKRYLRHAKTRTRGSTFTETSRVFRVEVLPKWKGKRLSEISRADVRQLIAAIAARPAPVSANRALASIKAFCNWAVSEDILTVSPAASVRPPAPETPRERTLTDDELVAVWRACDGLSSYGQGVRLLVLTGARRSEVFGMTADEIDSAKAVWNLPARRAKNNHAHQVPLSSQALAILESMPVFESTSFRE